MTKNNSFKKIVRAYMKHHGLNYTMAHKLVNGNGVSGLNSLRFSPRKSSLTIITGATTTGKTTVLSQMIEASSRPTLILCSHEPEISTSNTSHTAVMFRDREQVEKLVKEGKYSQFAIETSLNSEDILDVIPNGSDIILTMHAPNIVENEAGVTDFLDSYNNIFNITSDRLSDKVTLIKHCSRTSAGEFAVTDFHL